MYKVYTSPLSFSLQSADVKKKNIRNLRQEKTLYFNKRVKYQRAVYKDFSVLRQDFRKYSIARIIFSFVHCKYNISILFEWLKYLHSEIFGLHSGTNWEIIFFGSFGYRGRVPSKKHPDSASFLQKFPDFLKILYTSRKIAV